MKETIRDPRMRATEPAPPPRPSPEALLDLRGREDVRDPFRSESTVVDHSLRKASKAPIPAAPAPTSGDARREKTVVLAGRRQQRPRLLTYAFRGALALASVVLVVHLASGSMETADAPAAPAPATSAAAPAASAAAARPAASARPLVTRPATPPSASGAVAAATAAAPVASAKPAKGAKPEPKADPKPDPKAEANAKNDSKKDKDGDKDDKDKTADKDKSGRTLEQRAVEAAAAGAYADAAALYETLAKTSPDEPAYAVAARILKQRAQQ